MAKLALGIAGAAVGYFATGGNPYGAYIGFTIGYGVGTYLDPTTISAPSISDAPIQTSRDNTPRTIFHGLCYTTGNLQQKNTEVIVKSKESVGKGPSQKVEKNSRFRTFSVGLGEPITEVTRIWEDGNLVADWRSSPAIPVEETSAYAENIRIYLGGEDQLPDPDLEAEWGSDNSPYYRGSSHVVWVLKDTTDRGGSIPQFSFEVNGSKDFSITSKPYPADAIEGLVPTLSFPTGWLVEWPIDELESACNPLEADYGAGLQTYDWEDAIESECNPLEADYGAGLQLYEFEEAIETTSDPLEADYGAGLVTYDWEDAIETNSDPLSGTLN